MLNFGLIGGKLNPLPPMLAGDFVWYSYDPVNGYFVDTATGKNYVDDLGSTVVITADGTKNGQMNSGHTVTVSGDGAIPVPINFDGADVFGSVTVFDGSTNKFEQVTADGVGSSKELVTNGDFSDGGTGWDIAYGSPSYDAQTLNTPPNVADCRVDNIKGIEIDKTYFASVDVVRNDGGGEVFKVVAGTQDILNLTSERVFIGEPPKNVASLLVSTVLSKVSVYTAQSTYLRELDNLSVKQALPLSTTFNLTDGTYGTIIKLHTGEFTQADLTAFSEDPTLPISWYYGDLPIPSGLVKGDNDLIWAVTEGTL